jgi:hypothetical protein
MLCDIVFIGKNMSLNKYVFQNIDEVKLEKSIFQIYFTACDIHKRNLHLSNCCKAAIHKTNFY